MNPVSYTHLDVYKRQGLSAMKDLVFIEPVNKKMEPYTTDEIIAECAGVKRRTVQKLLLDKQEQIEAFGFLRFEIAKIKDGRGRPIKTYHLNEQQATLLITFLRNTCLLYTSRCV